MADLINALREWTNENAGFVTVLLFFATLVLGWVSGIFQALRRRPKFLIGLIDTPTFCCTFDTGREYNGHQTHRTAVALYLEISNVGSAPSSIERVSVGYHNFTFWYTFCWVWLHQTVALADFAHKVGEKLRVFPFLIQQTHLNPLPAKTHFEIGELQNGVVYFEEGECWGSFGSAVIPVSASSPGPDGTVIQVVSDEDGAPG